MQIRKFSFHTTKFFWNTDKEILFDEFPFRFHTTKFFWNERLTQFY